MGRLRNGLRRFGRRLLHPRSWPVRWRLATVSAGLTLVILMLFGGAIGQIATQRIRDDFNGEVRSAVQILGGEIRIAYPPFGEPEAQKVPSLDAFVLPDDASARVLDLNGNVLGEGGHHAAALGTPHPGLSDHNGMRVATAAITSDSGQVTGYVQYGRSLAHVESTIDRVWLLIAGGIFGGTLLAVFAGVAIAGRAMRPIASLTATAREVAATRDPSQRMPEPSNDDEVGELARTLENMLRSLDAAQTEREAAMQKQREFVADASHELRTPLTSVLANLELLQASLDAHQQAEDREIVDSALRSSRRMGRLVSDLLLLARADAGRVAAHRRVDLAEIAGDAAAEAAPLMGEREFLIDNDRPLRVEGSRDELHRMVLNLLDNAIRHTQADACIELALRQENGDAVVEVADNGPGIPESMRTQVFARFVRGQGPADTARGHGTGLGLAIVSAVAESHDGAVEAAESASGGALFVARIPLAGVEKHVPKPLEAL
ncbi:MAG TPA: HAMP domain-containing sensor histidine kinase [Solirubrobacterales bacterium]|nr:HAMP domain-containing sensor histidine kinase [Solirubrobacterales bacterium]